MIKRLKEEAILDKDIEYEFDIVDEDDVIAFDWDGFKSLLTFDGFSKIFLTYRVLLLIGGCIALWVGSILGFDHKTAIFSLTLTVVFSCSWVIVRLIIKFQDISLHVSYVFCKHFLLTTNLFFWMNLWLWVTLFMVAQAFAWNKMTLFPNDNLIQSEITKVTSSILHGLTNLLKLPIIQTLAVFFGMGVGFGLAVGLAKIKWTQIYAIFSRYKNPIKNKKL